MKTLKLSNYNKTSIFLLSILFTVFSITISSAQCINLWAYGSASAPSSGSTTISTCTYQEEYNTISGVTAATTYTSTYSLGGCITVTQGAPGGPVVGTGPSPLNWTSTVAGTYYIHYTTSCAPGCGQAISCGTSTITYVSGGGGGGSGPCASITPLIGCGTSTAVSLSGTGAGWNFTNCWFGGTPGTESIFSFTATASGIHSINVTSVSGGYIDFFWMDASLGCSSNPANWNCISDVGFTGSYGSMNWVAGNTYYILLDPEGTGSYTTVFNVDCPNPGGPVTAGDCGSAQPVCTNLAFQIDPNGYGLVNELCTICVSNPSTNPSSANQGCLQNGELNSTWFTVNVAAGGTLEFSFGTPTVFGNCYDWIMWDYNPATTCTSIFNNTQAPVSCNWNNPCESYTGMSNNPLPAGGQAGNFEPGMNVNTGDQFVICFSNYSSALTTVPLNFFGTADISCTPLPVEMISFSAQDMKGYNELTWSTGAEVNCSHFEIEQSIDGETFYKIGEVKGAGTSLTQKDYRFSDYNPGPIVTYYRLKQYDFDGEFEFSSTIAVSQELNNQFKVVTAYPNPASDIYHIELLMPSEKQMKIVLSDINGRIYQSRVDTYNKGINHIELPVSGYKTGLYMITLTDIVTKESSFIKLAVD